MRNTFSLSLVILGVALLSIFARADAGDGSYEHKATGIIFPAKIGEFKLDPVTKNVGGAGDDAVAVPYNAEGIAATIFIRAKDKALTSEKLLDESLAAIKEMEKRGKYKDVKLFKSDGKNEREGWSRAAVTYKVDGTLVVSLIYCTVKNEYPVKLRITAGDAKEGVPEFAKKIQELVDAMGKK